MVRELERNRRGGRGGGTVRCCSWLGAPSPREILTLWKTEQAVRQGRGKRRRRGRRIRAQCEVGTPFINQSHQPLRPDKNQRPRIPWGLRAGEGAQTLDGL